MNLVNIYVDPSVLYQRQILNLNIGKDTKRIVFELRYLYKTDKWYMSLFDAQTGEAYCTYVPIVASGTILVNLLWPYAHKRIGWMCCYPLADKASTENPSKDNWGEFGLVWGDSFD